ncbi:DUF2378 family protein [Pyxidicoccus fallax]|uniref:DUF2378 family protein n=1 Tax=Pyxidicoccus fallax TaxID=394095 RepID=A0A848LB33_9BACT|nr:DUF2378 family protein [Pyxidicoccus fallax]NMO16119.1 DUF2378 family protein [Pyxidicoccus fallax]NPC80071.1 DUF2378 family protein [Pyxidicoccus fallax]
MQMPDTRLIYGVTAQGLFLHALGRRLSANARVALREAGMDLDQDLLPAYDLGTWMRCLDIALRDLWPDLPREEAWRRMGHTLVEGITSTMLGRLTMTAARALGPQLAVSQFNRAFRNSDNFVELRPKELGPGRWELWISDIVGRPHYYQGILEKSLELTGARGFQVSVLRQEPPACVFLMQWPEK